MHCCHGKLAGTWKKLLTLLAAGIVAVWLLGQGTTARADEVKSDSEAKADSEAKSDSEAQLIERRQQHFEKLPAPPAPPAVEVECYNPIDAFIAASWKDAPKGPTPQLCDDATFLRRAYLDLVGVIPTLAEVNRFLASKPDRAKREKLVDQLLARRGDYASHWAPFGEDALASQNVLSQGGILTRGNYRQWIVDSFEQNRPFDVMVAELIDPTMPRRHQSESQDVLGTKYSIQYVRNEDHTLTLQTAANVGQVFLGTSMKCASCHDHFENSEWPQDRFLAFAGLFAAKDLEHIRCELASGRTVPARFPFELADAPAVVPDEIDQRLHLAAQWIVDPANPRFARTIVNRLWRRFLGLGLFEPADDFREDTPACQPQLLDWLAHDFIEHGCDLAHTTRLIVTSRTYQLKYDGALEDHFSISAKSAPRYYRSPTLRRLSAEQQLDSIRVATTGALVAAERTYLDARSTALSRALGRPASRNEISTSRPDDVAVVQSLELVNGPELHEMIYSGALATESAAKQDPRRVIDRLYRTVLSRPATLGERNSGRLFLTGADSPSDGMKDIVWALVCSPEFQYLK